VIINEENADSAKPANKFKTKDATHFFTHPIYSGGFVLLSSYGACPGT
jgi:hypothetical protein